VHVLVVGLVGLPLLASALVVIGSLGSRPVSARHLTMAATGLTGLCALALLPLVTAGPALVVDWLPGTGVMGLTTGATGLYAVLVTTWGAFLVLLPSLSSRSLEGDGGGGSAEYPPLSQAVMLLALAGTNVAFLADHFLARYAALEVVALCVALAPLVEVRRPVAIRLASTSYLLLRLGDAGLLAAILILWSASGTLSIDPSLKLALGSIEGAGGALEGGRLWLAVAGFVLAVWVKLGGWPFHLWSRAGRCLGLVSQAWLYATVVPNLGIYLLYRVTPLLVVAGPLRTAALWLGVAGGVVAALIALTQADVRDAMVYIGAAQGGLALFAAASGIKPAVWLGLLALTPLRLLIFLTADVARSTGSLSWRRVAACLFGLAGLALVAFGLLTTWWAREAGTPLDALLVAEVAVALIGVWVARVTRRLFRPQSRITRDSASHWTKWVTAGSLGVGVLAGGLAWGPLTRHLATASHVTFPAMPTLLSLLRYAAANPALWVIMVLALAVWQLRRRSGLDYLASVESAEEVYDLEEALARSAQVLHAVVEVGIAERLIAFLVRIVVEGARATHRVVEHRSLEGLLHGSVRAVMGAARTTYRVVEHGGLDGLLRGSVRTVMDGARGTHLVVEHRGLESILPRSVRVVLALARRLQRWHTGRLQRSLLWVAVSLALAMLSLALHGP